MKRHASFNKKFRWFNTEYRFSEIVSKLINSGYTVREFLNDEDLAYYYSPDYIKFNKENGPDSIKYKSLADSIDKKSDNWLIKNVASLWIEEFTRQLGQEAGPELSFNTLILNSSSQISMKCGLNQRLQIYGHGLFPDSFLSLSLQVSLLKRKSRLLGGDGT